MKSRGLDNRNGARQEVAHPKSQQMEDDPIDDKPRSVYEIITRRMLDDLREDIAEVKGRVNTLLWLMIGAILVELLVKIAK